MNHCIATYNGDPDFPLTCDLERGHDGAHLYGRTGEWWSDPNADNRLDEFRADDAEYVARRGGAW